jgi:hypothetical protein
VIDLKRLERATKSAVYQAYAGMAGAALAGALLAPREKQAEAMLRAIELHNKMADVLLEEAQK